MVCVLVLCGLLASHPLLIVLGTAFLLWFGWEWLLFNQRLLELFDLPPGLISPGDRLEEALDLLRRRGDFLSDTQYHKSFRTLQRAGAEATRAFGRALGVALLAMAISAPLSSWLLLRPTMRSLISGSRSSHLS